MSSLFGKLFIPDKLTPIFVLNRFVINSALSIAKSFVGGDLNKFAGALISLVNDNALLQIKQP